MQDAADTDTFRVAGDWGPWRDGMTAAERRESILVLRTLASITVGRQHPLWKALYRAYAAADDAAGARGLALLEAAHELERLPALTRRRLMATYQGNMLLGSPDAPQRGRPAGRYAKAEKRGAAA
jgi:hypothetical protein